MALTGYPNRGTPGGKRPQQYRVCKAFTGHPLGMIVTPTPAWRERWLRTGHIEPVEADTPPRAGRGRRRRGKGAAA